MTKVIFHVGMPKCASTSIQAHFADNYAAYAAHGLLYPVAGRETTGYRSHRPLHHAPPADFPAIINEIAAEARALNCDNILLSSEELGNAVVQNSETEDLIKALQNHFGPSNVEVLFVIRNHWSFVSSSYAQFIKAGLFRVSERQLFKRPVPSINAYADCFRAQQGFDFFSFREFLQRFEAVSNGAKFNVMNINQPDSKGVIERVCNLFGIASAAEETRRNESLSQHELFCLLHARRRHGFDKVKPKRKFLLKGMIPDQTFTSPLFHIDAALAERIKAAADADRQFFESRFQVHINPPPAFTPDAAQSEGPIAPAANMVEFIDKIMSIEGLKMPRAKIIGRKKFT